MTFFYWLQAFISVCLVILVIFQRSGSDGIISSGVNSGVGSNSGSFISKLTVFFVFFFFINCIFLARDNIAIRKSKNDLINAIDGKPMIEGKDDNISVPILN